jgi:predicted  nucleic acid-binding Zn-ribbon protein
MPSDESLWNDALFEAAREIGSPETPAQLSRRGVRRVRSVSREKLSSLLDRAVEKALKKRGLAEDEVSELVDNMQAGMLDLLRGVKQVEIVRATMAGEQRALDGEFQAFVRDGAPDAAIRAEPRSGPRDLEREIRERDMEIERLQRRITKLMAAFQETERAFQHALASKHLDAGIASLYRVVQGLSPNAQHLDQKRALMEEIFRANLDLRTHFAKQA